MSAADLWKAYAKEFRESGRAAATHRKDDLVWIIMTDDGRDLTTEEEKKMERMISDAVETFNALDDDQDGILCGDEAWMRVQ